MMDHTPEGLRAFAQQHSPALASEITRLCGKVIDKGVAGILQGALELQVQLTEVTEQRDVLLEALHRVMDVDCPLTGNPSHAELVEFWEYEKTQGRGEADDRLFALAAIEAAKA